MEPIQKFYIEWLERRRYIKKFSPTMIYLSICVVILCLIDAYFIKGHPANIAGYALIILLALCYWHMAGFGTIVTNANYRDFLEHYEKLLREISSKDNKTVPNEYRTMFYAYEKFLKIDEDNELHVIKRLKKIPVGPMLEVSSPKERLKELAQLYIAVAKMLKK